MNPKQAVRLRLTIRYVAISILLLWGCGGDMGEHGGEFNASGTSSVETKTSESDSREPPTYPTAFADLLSDLESGEDLESPQAGRMTLTLSTWLDGEEKSFRTTFDTSQQVIALSIPEDIESSNEEKAISPPLRSSLAEIRDSRGFRSASMLAFKAKAFDDGLYAAVELAADQGLGDFPSRRQFLADLAAMLSAQLGNPGINRALGLLAAASKLGGHAIEVSESVSAPARRIEAEFSSDPLRSKPIGFYTWNSDLHGIFQRDRMLQTPLDAEESRAIEGAINGDSDLLKDYMAALRLPQRLTNAPAGPSLLQHGDQTDREDGLEIQKPALFPPSRAYETDLIKKLYGSKSIPANFNLADELVRRIQAGQLDLKPTKDSGWYDYQTYALQPLVIPDQMPEANHLKLDQTYKTELIRLFKSLLALTRETHIKQLEIPMAGAVGPPPGIVLHLHPQLTQEPLASYYLRRAQAYAFVRRVLMASFGPKALSQMHRQTADGAVDLALDRELQVMESLFYGAYVNTMLELGGTPDADDDLALGKGKSLKLFRQWNPAHDADVGRDMRMMVPVFFDVARKKTKVWVILGVTSRPLNVRYANPPKLMSILDGQGNAVDLGRVHMNFTSTRSSVAYPVMAKVYVKNLLDRKAFRTLCDKYKTQQAILKHLK